MFLNVRSVLSQCNTQLRLLHLLYDIEIMKRKKNKTRFFYVFDKSEPVQGPIYIIIAFNCVLFEFSILTNNLLTLK